MRRFHCSRACIRRAAVGFRFQFLDWLLARPVAFECSGKVTRKDYDEVLEPAVEAAFKDQRKLRLFYKVSKDFEGIDPGAAWEDFAVGVSHLFGWECVAGVTDIECITNSMKAFRFLMPAQVKVFPLSDEQAARRWLARV